MRAKTFQEYRLLREAEENEGDSGSSSGKKTEGGALGTKIMLGDGNDLPPFEVSDDPKSEHYGKNKNLAPVVRAFKGGGNWGWSRDETTGDDKPVKIGTKKLYLAGGAVRSHLKGEKARNIELVTNGSPDEVYHLLKQNGFEFVDDKGQVNNNGKAKPPHPNRKEGTKQFFWVNKSNKGGRPFSFGIRVNEDEFELDVMQKTPRGFDSMEEDPEPGTHADDASGRDFTINGLYILLSNDNGPNKELHDFHGGIHHMLAGRIVPIGGMESLNKYPARLIRFVRFMHGYGNPKTLTDEDKKAISMAAPKLSKYHKNPDGKKYMMDEFKKGMKKDDKDSREFLKLIAELGLGDSFFPGKLLDTDLPKELSEMGDKDAPLAWMLRMNHPDTLQDLGLEPKDLKKVMFLIKSLGMDENMDENRLDDLTTGYMSSGISSRKLRDWTTKLGKLPGHLADAFVAHVQSPRIKHRQVGEDGQEKVSDAFLDLIDPFTGQEDQDGIKERRRHMELDNFRKHMEYCRPQ